MPCFASNEVRVQYYSVLGFVMRRRFGKKLIIKSDHKSLSGFLLFHLIDQDKSASFGKDLYKLFDLKWPSSLFFWKRFYWYWIFVFYRESLPHGSSLPRHGQRSKSRERWEHWPSNYMDTKEKCRFLKKLTCKGTLCRCLSIWGSLLLGWSPKQHPFSSLLFFVRKFSFPI